VQEPAAAAVTAAGTTTSTAAGTRAASNRAGVMTEGAVTAPAPAPRTAGGLPGLANPFPANGLIWTAG